MGLAASQGRMLLLTARKTDLEFRAQQISQKRINLSRQLEGIATKYEAATSDRQMKIALALQADAATAGSDAVNKTVNLTYATLISGTVNSAFAGANSGMQSNASSGGLAYQSTTAYRLVDADGAIVISDVDEIFLGTPDAPYPDDEKSVFYSSDGKLNITDNEGNIIKYTIDKSLKNNSNGENGSDGPNYLQDCLRNGKYLLQRGVAADTGVTWSSLAWDSTTNITDSYYAENDDKAEVEYNRKQNEIQNQDKKLELELDNIETERSEVKTEEESVAKVVSDNIEDSCNIFA